MWDFVGLRGTHATDLPRWEELQVGPYLGSLLEPLRTQLRSYHAWPKASLHHMPERAHFLRSFAADLTKYPSPAVFESWWQWLQTRAMGKADYLEALLQLHREGWMEKDQLAAWHLAAPDGPFQPLTLTQHRYAAPDQSAYWGDYWMKTLDPCHRYLPELQRVWEQSGTAEPYLIWLENYSLIEHSNWFRYFTDSERAEATVRFLDGRLCRLQGRPLHCAERQHFLFIIGLDQTIHAVRAEPHLCHASFTRGRPVLASGQLQAREGRIVHLKFASGHYISGPEHWQQALEIFLAQGLTDPESIRLTVFDRFRYISGRLTLNWIKELCERSAS